MVAASIVCLLFYPGSEGYGEQVPVLSRADCAVIDSVPEFLGVVAGTPSTGYGHYGFGAESYRYVCDLWAPDKYVMVFQVLQAGGDMEGPLAIEGLLNEPSTEVQENSATTVTSGGLEVHVQSTWYPTNPQGAFSALHYDQETESMVMVDIKSLRVEDYEATTPQQIADLLVEFIAAN